MWIYFAFDLLFTKANTICEATINKNGKVLST